MTAATFARRAILGMTLIVSGCYDPVTEVVVAITSDLTPMKDVETLLLSYEPGDLPPSALSPTLTTPVSPFYDFPTSATFTSTDDGPKSFSISVQLTKIMDGVGPSIVMIRKALGIKFVPEQTRMLVLPLMRVCACQGTTCPNPGSDPDCEDMVNPELVALDPALAPSEPGAAPPNPTKPGVDGGMARPTVP